jgi:hypothetical protein
MPGLAAIPFWPCDDRHAYAVEMLRTNPFLALFETDVENVANL